jgi:RNA polymerase sigma-70 factor (ECF subfamily)
VKLPHAREADEKALLEAWRAGDLDAGDELLRRHFVGVYRFFTAHLSPSGRGRDAEDLTQRTFEACISSRDRVHSDFRGYLFGVARRQLWLEWESRRSRGEIVSPSDAGIRDVRTSPSAAVAKLDEQKLFLSAIESLPAEFRVVLERFYWEDQPIARIAEELGIALGTVKSRLFRGKALLRDKLADMRAPDDLRRSAIERLDARTADLTPPDTT